MLVQTREQFESIRTIIDAAETLVVDTETTGLNPHQGDRLCGVAVKCDMNAMNDQKYSVEAYFPFRHKPGEDLFSVSENLPEAWLPELLRTLNKPDGCLVFHHAKFDLTMFAYEGFFYVQNPWLCTQIMSWLNCEWESHSLKDLHDKYIPGSTSKERESLIKKYVKKEGAYHLVPPALMEPYACGDVRDTADLLPFMIQRLDEQELMPLLAEYIEFTRRLFDIEWAGLGLDLAACEALSAQAVARMRELEDEMGFDPSKNQELARRLFLAPPEGLGLTPGALTKTSSVEFPEGIPECRKEFLAQHLDQPLVRSVAEYKGLVKANSTWFAKFIELAKISRDGRLHTTFNGTSQGVSKSGVKGKSGTVTGRINSSGPNVQQFPRKDEAVETELKRQVKTVFVPARQRWGLYEFDYSQIEGRLGACYADAGPMLDAYRAGEDSHSVTAARIGTTRQTAKHVTYTVFYAGGAETLAGTIERLEFQTSGRVVRYPVSDAQSIIDEFYKVYPGVKLRQQECARLIRKRGFVKMWNGRRRHYERWYNPELGKQVDNGHKAFNSVIQGGAAEIIKWSMLTLPHKPYAYRVVSQVHDSLWIEVCNDYREDWLNEIKWYMEWPSRDPRFACPFDVDVKLMRLEPYVPGALEAEWAERGISAVSVG